MRNFIRKSKKLSIFKRFLSFIFALIIISSFVLCQFYAVYAAEVEVIETVAVTVGSLYSAVQSGEAVPVVSEFFKKAVVFSSEVRNNYFMPPSTVDTFYDKYMISLDERIQAGDLLESDIGNIKYIGGQPVSFDCPTLGCYAFFCNQAIADRIDAYVGQKNISVVASIVDGYWDEESYRVRRPNFNLMLSNPDNWQCCFDITGSDAVSIQAFWDTFGKSLQDPSLEFYQTGVWAHCFTSNWSYDLAVSSQYAVQGNEYLVLKCPDYQAATVPAYPFGVALFYYDPSWGDFAYKRLTQFYTFYGRENVSAQAVNNLQSLTISKSRLDEIMYYNGGDCIAMSDLFPESALDIIEGANTGVLNPADEWWNTRDWEDVVDAIGDAVAESVGAGATDIPLDIPDVITADDLPVTDFADDDFVDTTGIIAVDDETDMPDIPSVNPDPDDPSDERPDLPQLKIPVLLTLFPFCIPFDIKRSIEWFGNSGNNSSSNNNSVSEQYNTGVYNNMSTYEVEEINGNGMEPVFAIPLNIGVSGRPVLQSTVVLDLTEYGIPVLVQYLKTVQIIAWIIVLCWGTYKVIY